MSERRVLHIFKHAAMALTMVMMLLGCSVKTEQPKRIKLLLVLSSAKDEITYGNLESSLRMKLNDLNYIPEINCIYAQSKEDTMQIPERMWHMLNELTAQRKPDLVVMQGEIATRAFYRSHHHFCDEVPAIALTSFNTFREDMGTHPKLYGVAFPPDYNANLQLIERVMGPIIVEMNADDSELGHDMRNSFNRSTNPYLYNVTWQAITIDEDGQYQYNREGDIMTPPLSGKGQAGVYFVSYDAMNSDEMIDHFNMMRNESRCLLHDGFSGFETGLCKVIGRPVFAASFSGFDNDMNIVGGYFTTPNEMVDKLAQKIDDICYKRDMDKRVVYCKPSYNFDYKQLRKWNIDISRLPNNSTIINMPFSMRYRFLFYIAIAVTVAIFLSMLLAIYIALRKSLQKKRLTTRLEQMNNQYLFSIGSGRACTWWYTSAENVVHFDNRIKEYTGKDQTEYPHEQVINAVHPDDLHFFDYFRQNTMFAVENNSFEFRMRTNAESDYKWYRDIFSSQFQTNGEFLYAGVFIDIDEYKKSESNIEDSIKQVKNSDLKQSFLANMSHEIRTPLNAIVGFSNLLIDQEFADSISDEERMEYMELISTNSELLQNIIDSILEISNIETGGLQFVINSYPVERLTREVYQSYKIVVRKDLEFLYDPTDKNVEIDVDKLRFTQVMDNLLSNSNKFTAHGHIKFGSMCNDDCTEVTFYVEDTGKGVEKEKQELIFERFYKADESAVGTGLGLPLCKLITEKMNGRIWVESEFGKGSRFNVAFPCRERGGEA